ncbi:MAG: hypothetical protein HYY61_04450, partial [Deltaproteobacteria bacterium]|nr:hypothetical protein [Deltaproteobacteria bacterium]
AAYQKALLLSPELHIYNAIASIYENLNQKYLAQEALSHVPVKPPPLKTQMTSQMKPQKGESPATLESSKTSPSSSDEVIRALEKDLGIKIETLPQNAPFRLETPLEELSAESLLELSIGYKEMGLFKEAIDYLKKALAITKDTSLDLTCAHVLALCYLESHLYFECISLLEKTLQKNLSLPKELRLELLYSLSQAYELSGNDGKALFCLRQIEKEEKFYRDISDKIKRIRSKNTF